MTFVLTAGLALRYRKGCAAGGWFKIWPHIVVICFKRPQTDNERSSMGATFLKRYCTGSVRRKRPCIIGAQNRLIPACTFLSA